MQTNVQPDNLTDEQFLIWNAIYQKRLTLDKKYKVFRKVLEILSDQDGAKLGKRFMRPIEEAFAEYEVVYNAEPDYERFRLRTRNEEYDFYLRKKIDGTFHFEAFEERHPITGFMGELYMLKLYLDEPSRIEQCIAQINLYREARENFKAFRSENNCLFACLASQYRDVVKDV